MMKRIGFLLMVSLHLASPAISQIIHVPADQPSIQAGIDYASDGDTVLVADSTYFENINFKGKAITVASYFLIDGDTSHISKTIIDGSQPDHPDTASVVRMVSGEDTTSVLCGFTITGGNGMLGYIIETDTYYSLGGGVNIFLSGGKIENNIIEENHLTEHSPDIYAAFGGGISAWVIHNHTAIIRNNLVRNNTYNGTVIGCGGGMSLGGGRFIIDGNTILGNTVNSEIHATGGGINYFRASQSGVIDDVVIRNNIITENEVYGGSLVIINLVWYSSSAGIAMDGQGFEINPLVHNNLIFNNHAHDGTGGGIASWERANPIIYNNTIVNNMAERGGKQLYLKWNTEVILFNNILWSDTLNDTSDVYIRPNPFSELIASYNNIKGGWEGEGNISYDPKFEDTLFNLSLGSSCVGGGRDSIEIEGTWYYAPIQDLYGNTRPHPIDNRVDLGAIESPYEGFVYIPGTAFIHALIDEGVDTNGDSLISYGEAEATTKIDVSYKNISDMTGIEAFVNLDTLYCHCNQLTSLDVSNNTALIELWCRHNILTSLNVSACTALTYLICNENQLTSLDISNNTALEYLHLSDMPTLHEVCVRETPFPPAGVEVDTTGSPNVCFETDCSGECGDESTGITECGQTGWFIYPNPTNTRLVIETGMSGLCEIKITSLNGQQIFSEEMEETTHQLDLSSFRKGVYFITIRSEDYVTTRKIIKL